MQRDLPLFRLYSAGSYRFTPPPEPVSTILVAQSGPIRVALYTGSESRAGSYRFAFSHLLAPGGKRGPACLLPLLYCHATRGQVRGGRTGGGGEEGEVWWVGWGGGGRILYKVPYSFEKILQRSLLSEHNTHYATPKLVFNKFSIKPNEH